MKILLLGVNGQVGWELNRLLEPSTDLIAFNRKQLDLEDADGLKNILMTIKPKFIINAAAYTNVDKAESEIEKAYLINAKAVGMIAESAKRLGATLFHYSTDYVFDGSRNGFYCESDQARPINIYGKSKLDGEKAIISSGCDYIIFRTSWVYGRHGTNFIRTILRLAQEKDTLQIVNDQLGVPTSAELIAEVTCLVLQNIIDNKKDDNYDRKGLYHLVPSGETNWYQFAKFIIEQAIESGLKCKTDVSSILPIATDDYYAPAKRPKNSRLNTQKLTSMFNIEMPSWKHNASRTIAELIHDIK
jgi:dTDP-4-dehydrorhamnose reductase